MIRDITLGQYYPGDSWVHRLDPRTKIIITFLYIVQLFTVHNMWGFLTVFVALTAAIAISNVPIRFILKGLKAIFIIIAFTFILNIFMIEGKPLLKIWIFTVTDNGLQRAVFMAIRLIMLIVGTSMLTLTTKPMSLTDGIESLLSPLKKFGVPVHEIAMMMTIALRFIPTLLEETDKIMKAQMARGADFESGNIMKRAKSLVPLLIPLFISAFRIAQDLAMAMEARCYRGGKGRTKLHIMKYSINDMWAGIISLTVLGLVIIENTFLSSLI